MIWPKRGAPDQAGVDGGTVMSWLGKLQEAKAKIAVQKVDPWLLPLGRVRGKIDYDGIERVTTQMLLDVLEVPQRSRRAGTYRHLSKITAKLGWTPVRVRARTRGDYLEQVRGYARDVGCRSSVPSREHAPVGISAPV
jgi:hypothetical protein